MSPTHSVSEADESIKNILRTPTPPRVKSARYVSVYHDVAKACNLKRERPRATMGPPEVDPEDPRDFLRKGSGHRAKRTAASEPRCLTGVRLPRPPPRGTSSARPSSRKDFVQRNISSAKGMAPKEAGKYIVDSPLGHKQKAGDTDLKYVRRDNFGSVPDYLKQRKDAIKRAEEEYERQLRSKEPLCKLIGEEERRELLNGLKEKWNESQKLLLCLPLVIDTLNKINTKLKIESRLRELEKHIQEIENHPYIYIHED